MGNASPKLCHTHEIAFEPHHDECRHIDHWSEDITVNESCEGGKTCVNALPVGCRICYRPHDTQTEEVLVVHHKALQKVDFLLRHDELAQAESPSLPECVSAVRRARIQRKLHENQKLSVQPPIPLILEVTGEDSDADPSEPGDAPGDFNSESRQNLASFERRMLSGISMWLLSGSNAGDDVREEIQLRLKDSDPYVLHIDGSFRQEQIPLHNIVSIQMGAKGRARTGDDKVRHAEDPTMCMYLTARCDDPETKRERTCHFVFRKISDAQEFKSGIRLLQSKQPGSAVYQPAETRERSRERSSM